MRVCVGSPIFRSTAINNVASHFDQAAFALGTKTTRLSECTSRTNLPWRQGLSRRRSLSHPCRSLLLALGLVWDPLGNAKTIVHVGYGILNDARNDLETFDRFGFGPPWGNNITINDPVGGWANPFQGYPGGDPFPLPYPPNASATICFGRQFISMFRCTPGRLMFRNGM